MVKVAVFMLLCLVGQLGMEAVAYAFKLWKYTSAKNLLVHLVLAVMVVFGGVSFLVSGLHWYIRYPIGVVLGFVYEFSNASGLDMFYFPGDRFLFFKGKASILVVISLMWGVYPLIVPIVYGYLAPLIRG
ncbi:MAG: hypothetical protein M1491_01220 [Deltaproteobacteria bacterium]|nr:hypothetical protein [Deltaproteobacteria bacterium]MCL5277524.1 hypothetical protein [Deltaproteobacteria bacterium]